jgi:1-acyl-sn-glycerol-3-phosphate acyltransferase
LSGSEKTGRPQRLARFFFVSLHLLRGLANIALLFPFVQQRHKFAVIQRWSQRLLDILDVRLRLEGPVPDEAPILIAANHVSWLDIFVINSAAPSRFVAKAEVRDWPVLGRLCAGAGTLFIERERRRDLGRVNELIAAALGCGHRVAIFPEGTTTRGDRLEHFHASLFAPAISVAASVYPAAIRYGRPDGSQNFAPAYVDNMHFLESLARVLAEPAICVELTFAAARSTAGKNRRELARDCEAEIAKALGVPGRRPRSKHDKGRGRVITDAPSLQGVQTDQESGRGRYVEAGSMGLPRQALDWKKPDPG